MKRTSVVRLQALKILGISLFALAAGTLAGCGGGDSKNEPTTSISAVPTADSVSGAPPMAVTFTATNPKGSISAYEWNFMDNSPISSGASVQHTFMEPGAYAVTLTVKDSAGRFNKASLMVNVGTAATTACAAAPALFTSSVWPSMSGTCLLCHMTGRVAAGTNLVFVAGAGSDLQNYNILRDYAKSNSSTLLSKTIGLPTHGGGMPFVNANSQQYKDLAALIPQMAQSCTTGITGPVAGQFWQGVQFKDDTTVLAKASVIFAGRNPTAAEEAAVKTGGAPVLRQTIRGYMTGPAFDRFLDEAGDTHFLTRGVVVFDGGMGLNATDLPSAANVINNTNLAANERNRFQNSMMREPIEMMKFIVKNDTPWTDIVAGNYTMANGIMTQYLAAQVGTPFVNVADDNEFHQALLPNQRLPGMREHAGVLSTHAWLQRFPTTPTNRNRHRVYILEKQFLATDVSALAMRPIDDGGAFKIPTMENPGCAICHDTIDPIAAGFQNWNEANRYLPFRTAAGVDHALPGVYRSANYPKDAAGLAYYRQGDNWFRDEKAPGYGATPMPGGVTGNKTALQWLGMQVANDPRFAVGAVHFWFKAVFNRDPLKAPSDSTSPTYANLLSAYNAQNEEFKEIATRFATNRGNNAYNVRDLLVDLVTSRWFKAERASGLSAGRMVELSDIGSQAMLNPAQLNRKLLSLAGVSWNQFNNPYAGQALNYGNFDGGLNRFTRANEYTMVQTMIADRMMSELSCNIVMTDFNKAAANRLLFTGVNLADSPATAAGEAMIQGNIRQLHKWLLKEDLAVSDPEVQRTYALYKAVWADRANAPARPTSCSYNNNNDPNYVGRSWAAVVGYMIGDSKFLFE
jgi:PKD repeat protein